MASKVQKYIARCCLSNHQLFLRYTTCRTLLRLQYTLWKILLCNVFVWFRAPRRIVFWRCWQSDIVKLQRIIERFVLTKLWALNQSAENATRSLWQAQFVKMWPSKLFVSYNQISFLDCSYLPNSKNQKLRKKKQVHKFFTKFSLLV